jgi:hypothetical protein
MNPFGIGTVGPSVAPTLDAQFDALLEALGEADELDEGEVGEADELDEGEFGDGLEATVVGPQAVAPTMANATTTASSARMADFIRTP